MNWGLAGPGRERRKRLCLTSMAGAQLLWGTPMKQTYAGKPGKKALGKLLECAGALKTPQKKRIGSDPALRRDSISFLQKNGTGLSLCRNQTNKKKKKGRQKKGKTEERSGSAA